MLLSSPEPVSGQMASDLYRAALAWEGTWNTADPSTFDPDVWAQPLDRIQWSDGDLRVIVNGDPERLAVVAQSRANDLFSYGEAPKIPDDYGGDSDANKQVHTFVHFSAGPEAEMLVLLGQPPVDGYLVIQTVLSSRDKLIPVKAEWRGRQLSPEEAVEKLRSAADAVSLVTVRARVPSPRLPPDVQDAIDAARAGMLPRGGHEAFVEVLRSLEPIEFLDAIDQMIPWMKGPLEKATLAWMDKDSELADHAWKIVNSDPRLKDRIRMTPWKSAIGNPTQLELRMKYRGKQRNNQWAEIQRLSTGSY